MANRILLVDDDRFLLENLKRLLVGNGYEVETAGSAEDGLISIVEKAPDLMILDLGLPATDGISFCRRIRSKWRFPVLMLTARTDAMDKVIGLEVGADDYLTKPFEPAELVARVRAHLRRATEYQEETTEKVEKTELGVIAIDHESRDAFVAGKPAGLTTKEFDLLAYMSHNVGRALSREILFEKVWGYDMEFNSNSLDVFVYRLRQKIEVDPAHPVYIHTVRGYGYKLQKIDS